MGDQKQDNTDEYHYDDLGTYESEFQTEETLPETDSETVPDNSMLSNPVIRNALIAVVVVIVLMAGYKIYTWFSAPKPTQKVVAAVKPVETTLPKIQTIPQPAAEPPPAQMVQAPKPDAEVQQKLSNLESNQQSIQSNLSVVEGQMNNVSSTVTQLNQKLESLTQTLDALNQKIDRQSQELVVLNERTKPKIKPKPVVIHVKQKPKAPPPVYYIQALIPGRAWLTSPNGATITIRNGSRIPGYGLITLIDPRQGRIVTSSGRIIRFSPADN